MCLGVRSNVDGAIRATSSSKEQSRPQTLARLLTKRNWIEIERVLSSAGADEIQIDDKGAIEEDWVVHFALRYGAPLRVIQLLSRRYPVSLQRPDSTGKFPCHVAAKYGACPSVMEHLVRANRDSAGVQDPLGKAPIHYVGEFYPSRRGTTTSGSMDDSNDLLRVVQMLREAAPRSFNLEDKEGCNAIEYALASDAGERVVRMMQRTAREEWRGLKSGGGGKRHSQLARDIKRSASETRVRITLDGADSRGGSAAAKSA